MESFITILGYIMITPFVIGSTLWIGYFLITGIILFFQSAVKRMRGHDG